MELNKLIENGIEIVIVKTKDIVIHDVETAMDFIALIKYETNSDRIILEKENIGENFFDLKTKIAGEILQKFINYHLKLAIVGDFSKYTSKNFHDFIYECNKGKSLFFVGSEFDAIRLLSKN